MKIQIPKSDQSDQEEFDIESGLVIIGANGSGKTRFGSKIEQLNANSKRISAQRILQISETVPQQDFEEALRSFLQLYKMLFINFIFFCIFSIELFLASIVILIFFCRIKSL